LGQKRIVLVGTKYTNKPERDVNQIDMVNSWQTSGRAIRQDTKLPGFAFDIMRGF